MPLRGFRKQVFPSLNKAVDGLSEALRNLSAEPEWFYGFLQDSLVLIQGGEAAAPIRGYQDFA